MICASPGGADISDFELDSTTEDVAAEERATGELHEAVTNMSMGPENALGITSSRLSDVSTVFEGGIAPVNPTHLQVGTEVIKLTKKKRKTITLWLDPNLARICCVQIDNTVLFDDCRLHICKYQRRCEIGAGDRIRGMGHVRLEYEHIDAETSEALTIVACHSSR